MSLPLLMGGVSPSSSPQCRTPTMGTSPNKQQWGWGGLSSPSFSPQCRNPKMGVGGEGGSAASFPVRLAAAAPRGPPYHLGVPPEAIPARKCPTEPRGRRPTPCRPTWRTAPRRGGHCQAATAAPSARGSARPCGGNGRCGRTGGHGDGRGDSGCGGGRGDVGTDRRTWGCGDGCGDMGTDRRTWGHRDGHEGVVTRGHGDTGGDVGTKGRGDGHGDGHGDILFGQPPALGVRTWGHRDGHRDRQMDVGT